MLRTIAEALFAAEGTRARTAKVEALAGALRTVDPFLLPFAARFLTGNLLATDDARVLGAGGRLVFDAATAVTGMPESELGARIGRSGDLGTAVGEAIAAIRNPTPRLGVDLEHVRDVAEALASTRSRSEKLAALTGLLSQATPLEGRYLVRAILGEMRVGAKEGILEDAIAKAFDRPRTDVRRAGGLLADISELAALAADDRLDEAVVNFGKPVGFMLATPMETAKGADLTAPHAVEEKIDGIRAQAHVGPGGVTLFARGKGSVTTAFPDITGPLAGMPRVILDGEIVVVAEDGRPRPFSAIQPRLKKTEPDDNLLRALPVNYLVYDLLYEDDASLLELPFSERRKRLEAWAARAPSPPIVLHRSRLLGAPDTLDAEFDAARGGGYEGLVLKRLDAPYAAGVRGFAWLKVKKAFATLDVVIVAAERGHGKRAGVLSDYTFAVWNDEGVLETVGKAYSGLTDAEIAAMTGRLSALALKKEARGFVPVKPEIVLEVAFDGVQRSTRHTSGFALRFPRIHRIRDDKAPEHADTVDDVRSLYEAQVATGHREESVVPKGKKSGRRPDVREKSKQLKLFDD